MTKTIAFFSASGGAGVTALAIRTAWLAAAQGISAHIVDADERGYSDVSRYLHPIKESGRAPEALITGTSYASGEGAELIVVDRGNMAISKSRGTKELGRDDMGSVTTGDIVPVAVSHPASWLVTMTIDLIKQLQKTETRGQAPSLLINGVDQHTKYSEPRLIATAQSLKELAGPHSTVTTYDRKFGRWLRNVSQRSASRGFDVDEVLTGILNSAGVSVEAPPSRSLKNIFTSGRQDIPDTL